MKHHSLPWYRLALMALTLGLLAACQTPPPAPEPVVHGLTEAQVTALITAGFNKTDDTRSLNFDGRILFDTDTDALTPESRETIRRIVDVLKSVDVDHLQVEGHADNVGGPAYNQTLSLRRAETVAQEIAANGIPYENITVRGFGNTRPIATNRSDQGRIQNRRVVIIVPMD